MTKYYYQLEDAWRKHQDCDIVIYWNQTKNGRLVPGLYCKEYGTWIQWLDERVAYDLIDTENIEVVLIKPVKKKRHPIKWITTEELGI